MMTGDFKCHPHTAESEENLIYSGWREISLEKCAAKESWDYGLILSEMSFRAES